MQNTQFFKQPTPMAAGRSFFRQALFFSFLAVGLMLPFICRAAGEEETRRQWWTEMKDGFSTETSLVAYTERLVPFDSAQNPDNLLINFPTYAAVAEIRNKTRLQFNRWELNASPRLEANWSRWESGAKEGQSEDDNDLYLQYGRLRWNPADALFFSYGRENLQWGPSYLYAPANPFFKYNGKQNPHLEIDGKEFAQMVWLPSFDWTVALIYQDGDGRHRNKSPYFSRGMALKADVMGTANSGGAILSANEDHHFTAGAYCTWVAGEAMLVYGEGAWGYGTSALYPVTADNYFGTKLAPVYEDEQRGFVNLLLGTTYTFEIGPTLVAEYLYYGQGYDRRQWEDFNRLRNRAENTFLANNSSTPSAAEALSRSADPGLRFLRRNYLMLQLHQSEIVDLLDYSLRWTQNLDDGSRRFSATIDLYATDRLTLFGVGALNAGAKRSEFSTFLSQYAMVGFEYGF